MNGLFGTLGRRALFTLDPETAHGLSITALRSGLVPACRPHTDPRLAVSVAGLDFPNPLGMAAGFDKNCQVAPALFGLGFGFVEIGTVTPKPQAGNPKPRIFRLEQDRAVINRLGFNNEGHSAVLARIKKDEPARRGQILGVNIGANKDSADRVGDYVTGIKTFADVAGYFTVNISSPNTPGLRNLQSRESLAELLGRVLAARDEAQRRVPVFLKIAPDLSEADLDGIAAESLASEIDGLIVSNTTISRKGLTGTALATETGGLSGAPLFDPATIVLAKMRSRLGPDMPLIGVGGIEDAQSAAEKIRAGADLVQFYTGFIYGGPGAPSSIIRGLSEICTRDGLSRLTDIRDLHTKDYAARALSG